MLLIYSLVDGHLGYFLVLAIVNNVAVNTGVQISLQDPAFNSLEYTSRSRIAVSYDNSIFEIFLGLTILFP